MTGHELLAALAAAGVSVTLCDGRLQFRPASRIPPALAEAVRAHAPALAEALTEVPRDPCACGSRWFWRLRPGERWKCWVCDFKAVPTDDTPVASVHVDDGRVRTVRPKPVRLRCVICDAVYPETVPGASWLPSPDGGWWPRCPTCTSRGRGG